MKKILITGANGFVGRHLCAHLARAGWEVSAVVRTGSACPEFAGLAHVVPVDDLGREDSLRALPPADAVVHLAARVHVMHDTALSALAEYRRVNCAATVALARRAAGTGARRFVFVSTVKVNGERTSTRPFSAADAPAPGDPYAISKWEAEQALAGIAAATGMHVITLRPPLIYGPGVKGNFPRLMKLVARCAPLPLAGVHNSRSLLYVGNLVSAIERALRAEVSPVETLLVSDDRDVSTPRLIEMIAAALGVRARLFYCPAPLLAGLARMAGKGEELRRMVESLAIDCSHIKQRLQWKPPHTVEDGIRDTALWFREAQLRA